MNTHPTDYGSDLVSIYAGLTDHTIKALRDKDNLIHTLYMIITFLSISIVIQAVAIILFFVYHLRLKNHANQHTSSIHQD